MGEGEKGRKGEREKGRRGEKKNTLLLFTIFSSPEQKMGRKGEMENRDESVGKMKNWDWVKKKKILLGKNKIPPSPSLPISASALHHLQQFLRAEGENG